MPNITVLFEPGTANLDVIEDSSLREDELTGTVWVDANSDVTTRPDGGSFTISGDEWPLDPDAPPEREGDYWRCPVKRAERLRSLRPGGD